VPLDSRLREAGDRGEPLVWVDPDADAARAIVAVSEAIEAAKQTFKPLPVLS
jgi:ATP-binding protein involved in chromosome partitioning